MTKGQKTICNPWVMLREEFDDWAVLFDPDTGHGFGLNPTGVLVWKLLDGEHTVEALIEKLHGDCGWPLFSLILHTFRNDCIAGI